MTVLLSYSTSWSKNDTDTIPSTGELAVTSDSVLIAIDDLRKANAKMVELKYEKEINDSLRSIVVKDDELIRIYDGNAQSLKKQIIQVKRERNIAGGIGIGATLLLVISLLIK